MKVRVQGGSEINLTQKDFLAQGGEGQIYVVGSTAYKVYADPSQVIPAGKIQELAEIKDPRVVKPEKLLLDTKDKPVGFTSKFVHSDGALCQIFTRSFRDRHNLSSADVLELVKKLRGLVQNIHAAKVLVVDMNEMNFLLSKGLKDIYAIDVASYQTPHYRATALMESVRDRHMKPGEFTEGTDWFAFGILSFQMIVGIHPFKGKHPKVKTLDDRMKQNISVLNPEVGIPQTCYPLSSIPQAYLEWYKQVFEKGARTAPPTDMNVVFIPVAKVVTTASAAVNIQETTHAFDGNILAVWEHLGGLVVLTDKGTVYHDGRRLGTAPGAVRAVGFTGTGKPVLAGFQGTQPVLTDITGKVSVDCGLAGEDMMTSGGALYLKNGDKIVSMGLLEVGEFGKVMLGPEVVANVLEHATKLYDGVAVQSLLGATYASFFPSKGTHYQVRMPELDGYKITEAKADGRVLMVVGAKNKGTGKGTYDRLIFRFDEEFQGYDTRVIPDITPTGLNFVVLDTGICVSMTEEETLELFSTAKGSNKTRIVMDKALAGDMKLCKFGGKVGFSRGDRLFSLSLK